MAALSLVRVYQHSFDTHPNSTLAITGGFLNALGDVVAQLTQSLGSTERRENRKYDFVRTARFFCFGFMISPIMGRWNTFLETRFPLRPFNSRKMEQKVSLKSLSKRVACDQVVMAPIGLALFLGSMGMMEMRSPRQIGDKFRDLYRTAIINNWKVWPLAQFVNFRYMPLPYRVPFSQACGVFWTLYLSILNSEEDLRQDKQLSMQRSICS